MSIDDADLRTFIIYASRERSLDRSLAISKKLAPFDFRHDNAINALRALNLKMLLRNTRKTA